ncbi:tRNA (cytidine(34)-2'-O)-methyltransferase [Corynebacterium sp. sy017]|uniref:tRNA (cytidine(34)-2'-O)-methyltransferase n=1 Tax=unclassified Corynebacterium TaxID=2624378 RepID=UPI001186FADB|nr:MULTISPECIES: tRNA (cytidine(34)-2'-O)-methyltransferase [unclassified Corynebacterium]MBP3088680.1 tRNA (cytidine(34)-2'-O)-methyltransferase [Corynebacterium sp. sy017]QDZ42082.1 tRNA (cytidine(34)-2'-O)-methyltransferase [Corynebacterium sp. sy039]TSD91969.1 tRNA (cytidine(34)-2'-O)-methyltransferase [Corynebacterium sp. SY003]
MSILNVIFHHPVIPPNTGNAIRMCAGSGAHLHLVNPGFDLAEKNLRRAGLDYHDLAQVSVYDTIDECFSHIPGRVFAFTTRAHTFYTDISYQEGDALLFGTEPSGLDDYALCHDRITEQLRIPMLPSRRSMNLSNAASIATYEAWRQLSFSGAI